MTLRRRDVEQWMSHRRLPDGIRRYVDFAYKTLFYPLNILFLKELHWSQFQ